MNLIYGKNVSCAKLLLWRCFVMVLSGVVQVLPISWPILFKLNVIFNEMLWQVISNISSLKSVLQAWFSPRSLTFFCLFKALSLRSLKSKYLVLRCVGLLLPNSDLGEKILNFCSNILPGRKWALKSNLQLDHSCNQISSCWAIPAKPILFYFKAGNILPNRWPSPKHRLYKAKICSTKIIPGHN